MSYLRKTMQRTASSGGAFLCNVHKWPGDSQKIHSFFLRSVLQYCYASVNALATSSAQAHPFYGKGAACVWPPRVQGRIFVMMKFLQKLGKSLMLPVAVLPICGLLMGIGYALCPSTMQGGSVTGLTQIIGFLLVKAGGALIDNMQILFVIGVAVGMADEPDGTPALAGLASWPCLLADDPAAAEHRRGLHHHAQRGRWHHRVPRLQQDLQPLHRHPVRPDRRFRLQPLQEHPAA